VAFDLQNNVNTLGNNLPANFSWIPTPNASVTGESITAQVGSTITDVLSNLTGSDQIVVYTVTPTSLAGCPGNSFIVTVTVQSEPTGPTGTGLICSDASVNFDLQNHLLSVGNGQASTFSWLALANGNVTGESISATAGNVITDVLENISNADQVVSYIVTPTGTNGCLGNPFTVDITVKSEPRGLNATALTCSDVALNVDLQNNINTLGNNQPATFSWIATANGLVAGESISAQNTAFITDQLTNVTGADQIVTYTVTPTGTNGCVGNSFTITVTVRSEPRGLSDVVPICSDDNVNYDLQIDNINLLGNSQAATFTWIAANNVNVTGENTLLQTTTTINDVLNNVTGVNQTVVYTITPTGTNGCAGDVFTVSITVRPEPLGLNDTKTICSDNNVSYNLQNNLNTLGNSLLANFSWVAAANANVAGESTVTVAGGVINDNLNNVTSTDQTVIYTVTPIGTNGCAGNDFTVQMTVQPEPLGIAGTKTICSDASVNYDLQLDNINAGGNNVAATFSWIASNNPNVSGESTSAQATTTIGDVLNNITSIAQTVVYTVIPTGVNGCLGNDFTVTVTVNPEPTGQNDTDLTCNVPLSYDIQATNINVFGNGVTSVFTYTVGSSDQTNVPAGVDRVAPTALPITDSYTNSTGVDVFMTYTITPISSPDGCAGNPFTYVVTVRSRPIGNPFTLSPNVCSSIPFVVNPQTGIINGVVSTFTWSAVYSPLLTGGVGSGNGNITETLSNVTAGSLAAIYTITPSAGPCQGPTFDITVAIDPQPVTDPSLALKTICSDLITGIALNTNGISIGATNWDVDRVSFDPNLTPSGTNAPDPGIAQGASYILNDTYTNVSFNPGNVIYKVTPIGPAATNCRGVDTFITLTVNPEPVMNPALATPPAVCSDEEIGVTLSTNGTSVASAFYIFVSVSALETGNAMPEPIETGVGDRLPNVIFNDSYTNLTNASFLRTYEIKPKSAAGCLGDVINIPVEILAEPEFTFTSPPPICTDESIDILLERTATSTTIDHYRLLSVNWDVPPVAPIPGLLPGGTNISTIQQLVPSLPTSGYLIEDTYTNGTNVSLNARYQVFPVAPAAGANNKQCVGDEQLITVTIKPSPIVEDNLDEIVCNDAVNGIIINTQTSSATANAYEIIRPALPAGLSLGSYTPGTTIVTSTSTNLIASDRFVNNTVNPIPVLYQVRANTDAIVATGCYGPVEQIQVLVEPQITATTTVNNKPDICGGADLTNIVLGSPSNPTAGTVTFNFDATPNIAGVLAGNNLNEGDAIEQALVNSTNAFIDITYTIRPRANSASSGLGCPGIATTTVVRVRPKPRLNTTPSNFTVCEDVALGVDFASPTVPGAGASAVTFELIRVEDPNNAPSAPANGVSGFNTVFPTSYAIGADVLNDVLSNNNADELQHSIRYVLVPQFTNAATTCVGDESIVTVQVSPRAEITGFANLNDVLLPGSPVEVCSNVEFNREILFAGADPGATSISWTRVNNPASGITGSSGGAGNVLSQVLFNNTNDTGTVTYTFIPKSFSSCEGAPVNLVATVQPIPKVGTLASSFKLCTDAAFEIAPIPSPTTNASFIWTDDDDPIDPSISTPLTGTRTGSSISEVWSNLTESLANITYTITPRVQKADGEFCLGSPKFTTLNIAPPVDAELYTSSGDNDAFICEGDSEQIFFQNKGLSNFVLTYSENGGAPITLTNRSSNAILEVSPSVTTTYTILSINDSYNCAAPASVLTDNVSVVVNVSNTDATFTIAANSIGCSPFPVDFNYNQQTGVNHTWRWADGEEDSVYVASATVTNESVRHIFTNGSPTSTRSFKVELETLIPDVADPDDNYPGGCLDRSSAIVQVYPVVLPAISVDTDLICSGETIKFRNSSRGVRNDKWFYRVQGSSDEFDVQTGVYNTSQKPPTTTQFTLENTISNPLILEVVYQSSNAKCTAPDSVTEIVVYRAITAEFTTSTPTLYVGGHSFVDITNTSNPILAGDFSYEWDFGSDASPATSSSAGPLFNLDYTTPGLKEISLVTTNILASSVGLSCGDEITKTVNIIVPPLVADFVAIPLFACFPTNVAVVENLATGDVFEWQLDLLGSGGGIAGLSSTELPVFSITTPGSYRLTLTTTNSFTGDSEEQIKNIEIFEKPQAAFLTDPSTVFTPDGFVTITNRSEGANFYDWDFGNGNTSTEFAPRISYKIEGEYPIELIASKDNGSRDINGDGVLDENVICSDTITKVVIARDGGTTKIANAFTPNSNGSNGGFPDPLGTNDVFLPITSGVEEFEMQIFDRWGNIIFESRDRGQGWDGYDRNGNLLPMGVYVYKLVLRLSNGQRTTKVGDVTLIR
jgi:gliding motility-associated-like protein